LARERLESGITDEMRKKKYVFKQRSAFVFIFFWPEGPTFGARCSVEISVLILLMSGANE